MPDDRNVLVTEVIFGFNQKEISVLMEKQEAKKLFHSITGVSVIDINGDINESNQSYNHDYELEKRVIHPTLEELTEFFRKNIDNEIGSELIKERFYPNCGGKWRKILVNIHHKIQKALMLIEYSENGKFKKIKDGKYVKYKFIPIKINTLESYGIYF